MNIQVERCCRIIVLSDDPDITETSCYINRITAYDRCVLFTISFTDCADIDFILGKTNEEKIWYLDLQNYVTGEVYADSDIEDVIQEIECSDADYSDQGVTLVGAAITQMISDYAYTLKPPAVYEFNSFSNSDLPF